MNLFYYSRCILESLIRSKKSHTSFISQKINFIDFPMIEKLQCKHFFFDIDDTLNTNKAGLNSEVCDLLNQIAQQGDVVLLTNCSQKRKKAHQLNLQKFQCSAQLWDVGKKPNFKWFKSKLIEKKWQDIDCAFFGDRPSMDLWMAYKANVKKIILVEGFTKKSRFGLIHLIRKIESWLIL